ncbi:MAG TPA: hypothetical protein DD400_00355, partial [Rhodospirillaceae bacterium]|nr:hypothetical protein [Rhodospirillaceae bacterium]
YTDDELLLLMAHDSDPFNRWDAGQKILSNYILSTKALPITLIDALRKIIKDKKLDAGTKAEMLTLPSEAELGLLLVAQGKKIDPIKLYRQRQNVVTAIAQNLSQELWDTYEKLEASLSERASDGLARGQRSLKNMCLSYLSKVEPENTTPLAFAAATGSRNMTDKIVGLSVLADGDSLAKDKALAKFAKTYKKEPAIMDSWLSVQASVRHEKILVNVKKLMKHPAFDLKNPNRVSALIGAFVGNPLGFHAADGKGYAFVIALAARLDKVNPSAAARLVKPFLRWRDFTPKRQKMMRAALKTLAVKPKLSANLSEIVTKALAPAK